MIGLKQASLMRPELLQFLLEKLILIICYRLLVENENLGDVVVVDLLLVSVGPEVRLTRGCLPSL